MGIKTPSTLLPPASSHAEENGLKGSRSRGPAAHLPTGHPPTLFFFPPPLAGAGAKPQPQPHLHCALLSPLPLPVHATAVFHHRASLQSTLLLFGAGATKTLGDRKGTGVRDSTRRCVSTRGPATSISCGPRSPAAPQPTGSCACPPYSPEQNELRSSIPPLAIGLWPTRLGWTRISVVESPGLQRETDSLQRRCTLQEASR